MEACPYRGFVLNKRLIRGCGQLRTHAREIIFQLAIRRGRPLRLPVLGELTSM
jgi:hypothetical protein